jgi:predicted RNA-binding Zn-ribbon protein involved in translation (DUF1610 family)
MTATPATFRHERGCRRRCAPFSGPESEIMVYFRVTTAVSTATVSTILGLLLAASGCSSEEKTYAHEFFFDFRGKPLMLDALVAPNQPQFVRPEPEGLRIALPKDRTDLSPLALGTRFGLSGDFDVSAALEILRAETPAEGFGVGPTLFINKIDRHYEGATLGRLLRAKDKDIILADLVTGKAGPERKFEVHTKPSSDQRFRLRYKRTGAQLSYFVGKGFEGDAFEEMPARTFGEDPLSQIVMIVTTGKQPAEVDVRWIDLRIRCDGVRGAIPASAVIVEPAAPSRIRLFALFGMALFLLGGATTVAYWRWRRRLRATSELVSFVCPGCGALLRTKVGSAGKTVKCPKCGHAAVVPGQ